MKYLNFTQLKCSMLTHKMIKMPAQGHDNKTGTPAISIAANLSHSGACLSPVPLMQSVKGVEK